MMHIYDSAQIDELLEKLNDEDSVTMSGREFRDLAEAFRRKGRGRKPIAFDETLFDQVVQRWLAGEITARSAMQELDLKPNTFYRRVKERYQDMDELRKELKKAANRIRKEIKAITKQIRLEPTILNEDKTWS